MQGLFGVKLNGKAVISVVNVVILVANGRNNFSRTCNKCSDTESPTANTIFHRVRFAVRKAFFICFEMATTTKSLSATQMRVRYGM